MKEIDICITHEMVVKDSELYLLTDLKRIVDKLKSYIKIEEIKVETINNKPYLSLYGIRKIYGYKVEDGGFYDFFDNRYYHPIQLENKEIIELKKIEGYVKKKVR